MELLLIVALVLSATAAPTPIREAAEKSPDEQAQILEAPGDSTNTSPILAAIVIAIIILIFYLWSSGNTKRMSTNISNRVSKMYYNMAGGGTSTKSTIDKNVFQANVKDSLTIKAKPKLEITPGYNLSKPQEAYQTYLKNDMSEIDFQSNPNDATLLPSPRSPIPVKIKSPGLKAKDIPLDTLYGRVFKNNLKFFK
jgi:hypothetical protein